MREAPRILISNDDGIHAPGLTILEAIAHELSDDVWIVAPETEQSGASHSLTLTQPLRIRELEARKFAVQGTPSDCVVLALEELLPEPPDLLLSGVNRGQNLAEDVTYSGTIAAAMEATLLSIPAVALSQAYTGSAAEIPWETARRHGAGVLRKVMAAGWPAGVLLNINFPPVAATAVAGIKTTTQGRRHPGELNLEKRQDPRGASYYWLGFRRRVGEVAAESDLYAVRQGYISVTPLHLDLTHAPTLAALRSAFDISSSP